MPTPTLPRGPGTGRQRTTDQHISHRLKADCLKRQAAFLIALRDTGFLVPACKQLKIPLFKPYEWATKSPDFHTAFLKAEQEGRLLALARVKYHAYQLVMKGIKKLAWVKGKPVGHDIIYPVGLTESVIDRLQRDNWAISPNAVNILNTGPAAIQINLGDTEKSIGNTPTYQQDQQLTDQSNGG